MPKCTLEKEDMEINYHTDRRIWLSLEDYHNAGISSERSKEIIESIKDPVSCSCWPHNLSCSSMGINGNWIVSSSAMTNSEIDYVVGAIVDSLYEELKSNNAKIHAKTKKRTQPNQRHVDSR